MRKYSCLSKKVRHVIELLLVPVNAVSVELAEQMLKLAGDGQCESHLQPRTFVSLFLEHFCRFISLTAHFPVNIVEFCCLQSGRVQIVLILFVANL